MSRYTAKANANSHRGDRVQFTAPSKELQVANRDLGAVEHVNSNGDLRIRMDSGQEVRFNVREHPHLDYGYAVTSHSSQGQTADRVLINVDTEKSELLVNNRCAYVSHTSFASRRVTRVLDAILSERGMAGVIRCDNGPEFTSRHFLACAVERRIELIHIQPGKPTQNARVESFHGRLREECLTVSWFQNLFDARRKIAAWRKDYNEARPHSSLGYRTPKEFAAAQAAGFYTAEREARDSNAVPCPSRSPIPAQTREGTEPSCRILT